MTHNICPDSVSHLHDWEEISSETILCESPMFSIYRKHCRQSQTQKEGDFYTLDQPDGVNVIAITPEGKLVLVQQYRFGSKKFSLETPGGLLDFEEGAIEGALRELREETGYTGENARILATIRTNPAILGSRTYIVLVENCRKTCDTCFDPFEEIELTLATPEEIQNSICKGLIDHAITINAFFFYQRWKESKGKFYKDFTY